MGQPCVLRCERRRDDQLPLPTDDRSGEHRGLPVRWCSQLRRWPKPRRSLETGLGLAMLFAGMMVRMPGGLHAQEAQDSADKVSRSPVLSAVAGRMRVAHSGVSDMDFGG